MLFAWCFLIRCPQISELILWTLHKSSFEWLDKGIRIAHLDRKDDLSKTLLFYEKNSIKVVIHLIISSILKLIRVIQIE